MVWEKESEPVLVLDYNSTVVKDLYRGPGFRSLGNIMKSN